MRNGFLELIRSFLVATLCVAVALPGPAFALRPPQRESASGVEELSSQFAPRSGTEEKIFVYLDPVIKNGLLFGDPDIFRKLDWLTGDFWKNRDVQKSSRLALAHVKTYNRNGITVFGVGGRVYPTNRPYDPHHPVKLLVHMDSKNRLPVAAYEQKTGVLIYSNAERVQVFLDPKLESGKLAGSPKAFKDFDKINPVFWKEPEVRKAATVVFSNVGTMKRRDGRAFFGVAGGKYASNRMYAPDRPLRLLVVADPKMQRVTQAYDLETGEQVYLSSDHIQVHLNPVIKDGRLVGTPKPFKVLGGIRPAFWRNAAVREAASVVLANVPVINRDGIAAFFFSGQVHLTTLFYRTSSAARLLLVVDPKTQALLHVYETQTGKPVYPRTDIIGVYIDPKVEGGRLSGNPVAYKTVGIIRSGFWKMPKIREAKQVGLANVRTFGRAGKAHFFMGKLYPTVRTFEAGNPLRLLVVAEVKTRSPTAAYDLSTGEKVYPAPGSVHTPVYLDPPIRAGKLVGDPKPAIVAKTIPASFWDRSDVQEASRVVLIRPSYHHQQRERFSMWQKHYVTSRTFEQGQTSELLIVTDPRKRSVIAAYDLATGEQVYPKAAGQADKRLGALADLAADDESSQAGAEENLQEMLGLIPDDLKLSGREKSRLGRLFDDYLTLERFIHFVGEPYQEAREDPRGYKNLFRRMFGQGRSDPPGTLRSASLQRLGKEKSKSVAGSLDILLNNRAGIATYLDLGEGVGTDERLLTEYYYTVEKMATLFFVLKPGIKAKPHQAFNAQDLVEFHLDGKDQVDRSAARRLVLSVDGLNTLRKELLLRQGPEAGFDMGELSQTLYGYTYDSPWGPHTVYGARQVNFHRTVDPEWIEAIVIPETVQLSHEPGEKALMPLLEPYGEVPIGGRPLRELLMSVKEYKQAHQQRFKRAEVLRHRILRVIEGARERQAGAEERTEVYLDATVKDGALAGSPQRYRSWQRIPSVFWEGAELKRAKTLILAGVPTRTHNYMVEFSVAGKSYVLGAQTGLPRGLRLLVTVDPSEKRPLAAYDMKTGRRLYPSLDLIDVYLDPVLEKGRILEGSKPFRSYQIVPASFWEEAEVLKASTVVLENISTRTRKSKKHFLEFSVAGHSSSVFRAVGSPRVVRLRVVVDPKTRQPVGVYDMVTGQQLSIPKDWTKIYLDPVLKKGRIVGDPIPFRTVGNIPPSLWKSEEVAAARSVVMTNIGTFSTGDGQAGFSVARKVYLTTRRADPDRPLRLLVIFDPSTRKPLSAHDQSTGAIVYSDSDLIRIYLDPQLEGGRLVEAPAPFREAKIIPPDLWESQEVQKASTVVLVNVPTSLAGGKSKMAYFSVTTEKHSTGLPFDPQNKMKLLVVADPETRLVTAAYDLKSSEVVYQAADLIQAYLDPPVEEGKLVGAPPVFSVMRHVKPTLWKNSQVLRAKVIAFDNVMTRKHMTGPKAVFNLAGFYSTTRDFDPQDPRRLLVLADPRGQMPTAAFDRVTGEQVYPPPDLMQVYPNPQVADGRLSGKQEPVLMIGKMTRLLWERPEIRAVSTVAVANVPTHRNNYGASVFSFGASKPFITSRRFDPARPLNLLVVADTVSRLPLAAYDMADGEQVFPAPQKTGIPADARLGPLADLAGEEPTQAGAEQKISIYPDPEIKDGRLVGHPKPVRTVGAVITKLMEEMRDGGAKIAALENVLGRAVGGFYGFSAIGQQWITSRPYDPKKPLKLLVLLDLEQMDVRAAYDQATGEKLYPIEDLVRVYLDAEVREGKLAGTPKPFREFVRISNDFWQAEEIQQAKRVVLEGIDTIQLPGGKAGFAVARRRYGLSRRYEPEKPLKLLIVVDPAGYRPVAAYDMATGEEVYSEKEATPIYLDPPMSGGRLSGSPVPFINDAAFLRKNFWNLDEVQKANRVVLYNVLTTNRKGFAGFAWDYNRYLTSRKYDSESPLRLLVVVDAKTQVALSAHDLETGEEVYSADDAVWVYLDPEIADGKLASKGKPFLVTDQPRFSHLSASKIKNVSRVAFYNVPTSSRGSGQAPKAGFSLLKQAYSTSRRFNPEKTLRLLVVADAKTLIALEAFDLESGERVFSSDDLLEVYHNPRIQQGRLEEGQRPVYVGYVVGSAFWEKRQIADAGTIVLRNVKAVNQDGRAIFHLADRAHLTSRRYDPKKPLRLLVVVDPATQLPREAYDLETAELVYPTGDLMEVYADPEIRDGKLVGNPKVIETVSNAHWISWDHAELNQAERIVLSNVNTREDANRRATFVAGRGQGIVYRTTLEYDAADPPRLLVVLDPRTKHPLEAYELKTGALAYSQENLIRIYLDPEIREGKLAGAPVPFRVLERMSLRLLNKAEVQKAGRAVFSNIPAYKISTYQRLVFAFGNKYRRTKYPAEEGKTYRLLLVVDIKTKTPIVAYDMTTGEEVFPIPEGPADQRLGELTELAEAGAEEKLSIYLDPEMKNGGVISGQRVFRKIKSFHSSGWDRVSATGARQLVAVNVTTRDNNGWAVFSFGNNRFLTSRDFNPAVPLRLTVVASVEERCVTAAYDMATGEQVYSPTEFLQIYLDPKMKNGRVAAGQHVLFSGTVFRMNLWDRAAAAGAIRLVSENVKTRKEGGAAVFTFGRELKLMTSRRFDSAAPLRLTVVGSVKDRRVTAAYDMATGKKIYPPADALAFHLDPEMEDGRVLPGKPWLWADRFNLAMWSRAASAGAKQLVAQNVRTRNNPAGMAVFSFGKESYLPTSKRFSPKKPLLLTVVASVAERRVMAAYDTATGEQVYPVRRATEADSRLGALTDLAEAGAEEKIAVYLDPDIQNGRLVGNPVPFTEKKTIHSSVWQKDEVLRSKQVVLAHVPVTDKGSGRTTFYLAQQPYLVSPISKQGNSLLVIVDPKKVVPVSAFDEVTGEQVYPPVSFKVKLFLNVRIRDGRLEGDPEPAGIFKRVSLKDPRIPVSESVVFSGVSTFRSDDKAAFQISKRHYLTTRPFDPEHPLVLLLEVDPATRRPLAAYDMDTGEQVFGESDLMQVYPDAEIADGRLAGTPSPFRSFRSVPSSFFANPAVRQAEQVVFTNVTTRKDGVGLSRFSLAGRTYGTPRTYDPKSPLRLIAVVNPKTIRVTAAYDMSSGEEVYSEEDLIRVYLSPSVKEGRLEGDPLPDEVTARISDALWKDAKVRKARTVVFTGVVALPKDRTTAVFYLNRQPYWTSRQADPKNPLRLLVEANPRTRIPLAAYDMETGEQVYPVQELVQIYLDPPLNNGFLAGDPTPFKTVRSITADFWDLPEVSRSKVVAFTDVRAGSAYGWATFFIARHIYQTDRRFDRSHPLKLLVLVDPRNRLPTAAYDMQTGGKIFPPAGRSIEVYVDPGMRDGKLQEDALPVWRLKVFKFALLKKSQVQQADALVIKDVPTHNANGRAGFQVGRTFFYTRLPFDPERSEKLLVVIDPKRPLPPRAAYLVSTGEQVYPAPFPPVDLSADYLISRDQLAADFVSGGHFYRKHLSPAIEEVLREDPSLVQVTLSLGGEKLPLTLKKHPQGPVVWTLARDQGHPEGPPEALIRAAQAFGFVRRQSPPADERLGPLADLANQPDQAGAEEITVYLDPEIKNGRLAEGAKPYRTMKRVPAVFWRAAEVQQAKAVVLSNVLARPFGRSESVFSVGGSSYRLSRQSNTRDPIPLLIVLDQKSRTPLAAYDSEGVQVLPLVKRVGGQRKFGRITIYLDPRIENGRLAGDPKPFKEVLRVAELHLNDSAVRSAKQLAFTNVLLRKAEKKSEQGLFIILRQRYRISKRFVPSGRLLVLFDMEQRKVSVAYDQTTGKQVYPTGDRVEVFRETDKSVSLKNVHIRKDVSGHFFMVKGHRYPIAGVPAGSSRLWVVVDAQGWWPQAAYEPKTRKQVYPMEDSIRIYLDAVVQEGKLQGAPPLYMAHQWLSSRFWKEPAVQAAEKIVLVGLPAPVRNKTYNFRLAGKSYRFASESASRYPLKLTVVVDPQKRKPIVAYDQATGKQGYPPKGFHKIYLDPVIREGKLAEGTAPFHTITGIFLPQQWADLKVRAAKTIAVDNVETAATYGGRRSHFSVASAHYMTKFPFHSERRLLVVLNVETRRAIAAYDHPTGQQVFPAADQIKVYLDPVVRDGKLDENNLLFAAVNRSISERVWKDSRVQKAKRVALADVPAWGNDALKATFTVRGRRYDTNVKSTKNLRLLVLVDPKTEKPIAAYNRVTGEKVYPIPPQPADERLRALADLVDDEPNQAGMEEPAGQAVLRWEAKGGANAVVLSSSLLDQLYTEGLKSALRNLPPELAERVYLAGDWEGLRETNRHLNVVANGSPDDLAVAVGQQSPAPEKVWLVGEFAPVYGWMLRQMGMDPEEVTAGADLEEFLSQMGILLGVPEAQVQSGVEELRRSEEAVEGQV